MDQIRIWKKIDINDIEGHLLICDDLNAYCSSCKKMGVPIDAKTCPGCNTTLDFITTHEKHNTTTGAQILLKMLQKSQKTVIEYSDYKHASDKKKAKNLFNS
ncbi:MAG: hypothetical protein JXK07_08145 [Spirochaetes bacterium]|nr:hypothetical protein [Spirochaetota bacterium]MBN2769991.1 hypothetical protein [Spirochaetota bacterium]HRX16575.1 hypothetical protein [Spirochaetota bacterium]